MEMLSLSFPAEVAKLAKGKKHGRSSGEQCDQAQRAPEKCGCGWVVSGHRIIGKVIRVRVSPAGPICDRGPCGPGKKGGQLVELSRVLNGFVQQPSVLTCFSKVVLPFFFLVLVGECFTCSEEERACSGVITILFQHLCCQRMHDRLLTYLQRGSPRWYCCCAIDSAA